MSVQSINSANGEVIESFEEFTSQQVDSALGQAHAAFWRWRETSFVERSALMHRCAAYLRDHKEEFARTISLEMGKAIGESEAEIEKCAWNCDYYAEHAPQFLAREDIPTNATESYVQFEPLGVVLAVMPWNFPFWQVFRFAAPALMAGNAAVLKHSSNVWRCALEIERVFKESGAPEGLFRTLLIGGSMVEKIIPDDRIAAVTLTGSDDTGSKVASTAGSVIKKQVMELGGSDYFVVLDDADLDAAAATATRSRFQNAGQSCIAAKRFIVVESVADEFERRFVGDASKLRVGDPLDPESEMGPMARGDLRDNFAKLVEDSVKMGARVALGGRALDRKGYFYAPTILTGVTQEMPIWRHEAFGPAAAVTRARDVDHAVELANDTVYGLGGNLWTRDIERARHLSRRLHSGMCFINGMTASDPRLPFGGIKRSGYGRELSSFGIREFVNIQTVWIGPQLTAPSQSASPQASVE